MTETDPPRRGIDDLLTMAKALDEGLLDYDLDLEELGAEMRDKVDELAELHDHYAARAATIGARAKQLAAKAAAFKGKAEGLLAWIALNMDRTSTPKMPGHDFAFALRRSPYVDVEGTPGPKEFLKFPGLVRRKFEWDKEAIGEALQAEDAAAMTIASIKRRPSVDIKPKA